MSIRRPRGADEDLRTTDTSFRTLDGLRLAGTLVQPEDPQAGGADPVGDPQRHPDGHRGEHPNIAVMRLEYSQDNGWELDLADPVDIASKLHWLKAFYRDERYPVMADKLTARDVVRQAAGDAYLTQLHWSGERLLHPPNCRGGSC